MTSAEQRTVQIDRQNSAITIQEKSGVWCRRCGHLRIKRNPNTKLEGMECKKCTNTHVELFRECMIPVMGCRCGYSWRPFAKSLEHGYVKCRKCDAIRSLDQEEVDSLWTVILLDGSRVDTLKNAATPEEVEKYIGRKRNDE